MKRFWHDGIYDCMRGHARRRGIPLSTLDTRIRRYGNRPENYERILHVGHLGTNYRIAYGRGDSVTQHAIRAGLPPNTVFSRLMRGVPIEEALQYRAKRKMHDSKRRELASLGIIV